MSQKTTSNQEEISLASKLNYSDDRYQGLLAIMGIDDGDEATVIKKTPSSRPRPNIFSKVSQSLQLEFAFNKSQ